MYRYYISDPYNATYSEWELKHVQSIDFSLEKNSRAYGLPTKSSSATQVFEMQGPVCSISIKFVRFDYEENVSNWDFMYAKDYRVGSRRYRGLDWYTSRLQTTRPFRLAIVWTNDEPNGETGDPGTTPTGIWNISVKSVSYTISSSNPGMGTFSIDMVERRRP